MLTKVTEGVWVHQSPLIQNNSVVVQGGDGMLVVDPGITRDEMACLANDIRKLGQSVVVGFATHPHWDHVLWIDELGDALRLGTAACADALHEQMADPDWRSKEAEDLPPEIADDVPMDLYGLITGLPAGAGRLPWDGPEVRVIEHVAHERGHAALLVNGVLIAGDMLSDILMPFPSPVAPDPLGDYFAGLDRLEGVIEQVKVVIPGHGSVGQGDEVRERIELDRAYVQALLDGRRPDDPRIGPDATFGRDWVPGIYEWHRAQFGPAS